MKEIREERYDDMLCILPPIHKNAKESIELIYKKPAEHITGFFVGEPYKHTNMGVPIHHLFGKITNNDESVYYDFGYQPIYISKDSLIEKESWNKLMMKT